MNPNLKRQDFVEALPGHAPEIGCWLWALEDTRRRTKRDLEGLSQPIIDWIDSRGDNSIGTLLHHIAAIEIDWLYADVLEGKPWPPEVEALFPYDVRDERGMLFVVKGVGLEEHLRRLGTVRAMLLEKFRGMSLDEFRRVRHFDEYDVTPEWVIHHLVQHEAEHRGQIGELRVRAERSLGEPQGFQP